MYKFKRYLLLPLSALLLVVSSCGVSRVDHSSSTGVQSDYNVTSSEQGTNVSNTDAGNTGSSESGHGSTEDVVSSEDSGSPSVSHSEEQYSSEATSETMHLVVGSITKNPSTGFLNPDVTVTYCAPLGGNYLNVSNPPATVSGDLRIVFTTSSSVLLEVARWNITLQGGGSAPSNVTSGTVGVTSEATLSNVVAPAVSTPTTSNSRYVQIVVSLENVTFDQLIALNEASYEIDVYYG